MKAYISLFSASAVLVTAIFLPHTVEAAEKKIDQRWFEVEVILFRQLGDKSQLKEKFKQHYPLPKHKTFDLLSGYLQPELEQVKYQLPSCEAKQYPESLVKQSAQLPSLYTPLTLAQINEQTLIDDNSMFASEPVEPLSIPHEDNTEYNVLINELTSSANTLNDKIDELTVSQENPLTFDSLQSDIESEQTLVGLSDEEMLLIDDADKKFASMPFNYSDYSPRYFSYRTAVTNHKYSTFCRYINQNPLTQLASSNDDFPVRSITGQIDGNEFIDTDSPYLIDSDSLQLKDIYLQLRRSKNFKPMLHIGWRQSLINRKPASKNKALKLYAGEHFKQQYLDQQESYQNRLNQLSIEQWLLQQQESLPNEAQGNDIANIASEQVLLDDEILLTETLSPIALKTSYILENIEQLQITNEQLLLEIDDPNLHADLLAQLNNDQSDANNEIQEPNPPIQPWYIDGLFRLHLSHYLYITADFNISSLTAAELATQMLQENTNETGQDPWHSIPFRQNRRVISGEVHYFDHPYMGMVVQIRRYKKPDPELIQDNTQAPENKSD